MHTGCYDMLQKEATRYRVPVFARLAVGLHAEIICAEEAVLHVPEDTDIALSVEDQDVVCGRHHTDDGSVRTETCLFVSNN
jgi:hypothetical protein